MPTLSVLSYTFPTQVPSDSNPSLRRLKGWRCEHEPRQGGNGCNSAETLDVGYLCQLESPRGVSDKIQLVAATSPVELTEVASVRKVGGGHTEGCTREYMRAKMCPPRNRIISGNGKGQRFEGKVDWKGPRWMRFSGSYELFRALRAPSGNTSMA